MLKRPAILKFALAAALASASAAALAAPVTYTMDPKHTDVLASWGKGCGGFPGSGWRSILHPPTCSTCGSARRRG